MNKWMMAAVTAVTLSGCAQLPNYDAAVKTAPPTALVGNWQTVGPQSGLVSDQAMASLIITKEGDTLDCRQWQRVIAKPGKVTFFDDEWVNVNKQMRVMTLDLEGNELHYDKLKMRKVDKPTVECQQALDKQAQPDATPQPQPSTVPAASTTFTAPQQ